MAMTAHPRVAVGQVATPATLTIQENNKHMDLKGGRLRNL